MKAAPIPILTRRGGQTPVRNTLPEPCSATHPIAVLIPSVVIDLVLMIRPIGPGRGRKPARRARRVRARRLGADRQPSSDTIRYTDWHSTDLLVRSAPMAKSKRRRIRARRKKANHGRRPNAGRGK